MDADGERLLRHIKMCHQIIAHLADGKVCWSSRLRQSADGDDDDYRRIEDIIATIRRATDRIN